MGIRSLAADLGITCDIVLGTDASAALGVVNRLGVGKTRHIDVAGCNTTSRIGSAEGRRGGERCGHTREEREALEKDMQNWDSPRQPDERWSTSWVPKIFDTSSTDMWVPNYGCFRRSSEHEVNQAHTLSRAARSTSGGGCGPVRFPAPRTANEH